MPTLNIRKLFALAIAVTLIFELATNMATRKYRSFDFTSSAEAQTSACVQANPDEVAQLAITVTYNPNASAFPPEQEIEVQRRLNGGPWTNLPNLPANTRSSVDNSVVQGTAVHKYEYQARVINTDGPSAWSDIGCFSLPRLLRPPPTPLLVVSAVKKGA